jgi:hypothetical protein
MCSEQYMRIVSSSNDNYRVCGEKSFKTNAIYHIIKFYIWSYYVGHDGVARVRVDNWNAKSIIQSAKYSACILDYSSIALYYCVLENRSAECTGSGSCPVLRLTTLTLRTLPFPLARKKMTETVLANALLTEYNIHKNYGHYRKIKPWTKTK